MTILENEHGVDGSLMIQKINKDLRNAAKAMTTSEARFLVDTYYMIQNMRIRQGNQEKALDKLGEPHEFITYSAANALILEEQIKAALNIFTKHNPMAVWPRSITGIGPVLCAGLVAYLDVTRSSSAGGFWNYAGLNPSAVWEKGQKRPWNAELKRLCWLIGESFVKVKSRESDVYGKIYEARKVYEAAKNERGDYAEQAARVLVSRKIQDKTARGILESGKLLPAHVHARCKRYAVKIFLSHLYEVMHRIHYGRPGPIPYAIAHLDHKDMIEVPNLSMVGPARQVYLIRNPSLNQTPE